MYTYVLLILVMLSLPISTFAACAIESQTPPLLTAYIQKVMTDTQEIQRLAL